MKKILTIVISFILIFSNINVYALEDVTINVSNAPYMDIVLTQTDKNINLTNFESDVKAKLQTLGIDTNNTDLINISTIETTTSSLASTSYDFSSIVNKWSQIGAPTWAADSSGQIYSNVPTGSNSSVSGPWSSNYIKAWWGTAIIDQNSFETEKFEASFSLNYAGKLHEGFCFNVTKNSDGTLNGYFFNITSHIPSQGSKLYRFDHYNLDTSFSYGINNTMWCYPDANGKSVGQTYTYGNSSFKVLASWNAPTSGANYNVKYENGNILIKCNGTTYCNINENTYKKGTYGFWGNNCETGDSFRVSNFSVIKTQTIVKEYSDVLAEPNWRENAYHFIVNVDNTTTMFDNGNTRASVLSRTMNDDIHFIDWGTTSTQTKANAFIKDNDDKGVFTLSNNYNQAIVDTANYIYSVIQKDVDSEYVIVDKLTNINVTPAYLKTNTITDSYPNGKWYINHDYKFYENNTGLSSQTQKYNSDLICSFDKPGKYDIYFADKLVKTIYVHRIPIASFNIGLNGSVVSLTSTSYDLDSYSQGINGIKKETWSYMKMGDSSWTNGKLTTFDKNYVYIVKLEVEDFQGATSYTTKYIGTGNPVAAFDVDAVTSKYAPLKIIDSSYDPEGYSIVQWNWILKKNGVQVATYNTQIPNIDFNTSALGVGTYQYILSVTNSKGTTSETYTKTFSIIEDITKPEILVNPTSCNWRIGTQNIEVQVSDSDSGLKNWQYTFTKTQSTPTSEWSVTQTNGNAILTTPSTTGEYYLHIKAIDNANNVLDRALGLYKIDNTIPIINNLTLSNDCSHITVNASDEGSGIDGYAITTNNVAPNTNEFQASNVLKIYKSGTYYVWVKDKVGLVSNSKSIIVNKKQNVNISWNDNNDSNKLRPKKVILTIYRNGTKLKDVEIDSTISSYTFENLDIMDSSGKLYTYTFNLNVNERYNVQVSGNTITSTIKTTTFSVIIPKTITLNGNNGKCSYNIKVNGNLYLNDTITITPSSSFILKDKNNILKLQGNITQTITSFNKNNLGTTSGNITLNKTKFAGKYNGTFNFNIKLNKSN